MLDIYPLDLYIWHMPDMLLLRNFGGNHVTPYIWHILSWWRYMWYILHTYGVTWWPLIFSRSSISGICQIYRSGGYMSSLYCHMHIIYLEYSIQSETWTWIFQEYAWYISNKIWNISHTRWLVSQLVLKGKMKGKCPCCTATWLLGVIHFMTQFFIFLIIDCMQTRTLVYIVTSCHTYHCTNVPWLIIQV